MKRWLVALVLGAGGFAVAGTVRPSPLPEPVHCDSEVSSDYPLPEMHMDARRFCFTLQLTATPSNNVEVAFGTDADADGRLSLEETELAAGWDCGHWFIGNQETMFTETSPVEAPCRTTLRFELTLTADGLPKALSIRDDAGEPLFADLADAPPAWLYRTAWDMSRLTARGMDPQREHVEIRVDPESIVFSLK